MAIEKEMIKDRWLAHNFFEARDVLREPLGVVGSVDAWSHARRWLQTCCQ